MMQMYYPVKEVDARFVQYSNLQILTSYHAISQASAGRSYLEMF